MRKPTYLTTTGRVALTAVAAVLVMAFGTFTGTARPQGQPHGPQIDVWVYPSGKIIENPEGLDGFTCLLAVGHPTRNPEVHCAPTPMRV